MSEISITYPVVKILAFLTLFNEIITKAWHLQFHSLVMCYKTAKKIKSTVIKISQLRVNDQNLLVSELGDLYVWGWNESGQLGLPCRNISTQSPPAEERHRYQLATTEPADKATGTWFTRVHLENTVSGQCEAHIQRVGPVQVQSEPTILDFGEDVTLVKVAGGARHSAVVTGQGLC